MDLNQRKLNRSEWNSIEIPVSKDEIDILNLIIKGYHDVNIRINKHDSIFTFLKIEYSTKMNDYLYNKYLKNIVVKIFKEYKIDYINIDVKTDIKIKSSDKIRIDNNNHDNMSDIGVYEFVLLSNIEQFLKNKKEKKQKQISFYYYTIYKLIQNDIKFVNFHILDICKIILDRYHCEIDNKDIIENAVDNIEKNYNILKYSDICLYEHQKEIFTLIKEPNPKLILYMAPTGTGKTLSPIAISEKYKIIFVCAARHVGLALARSAISVNKKIAFAFGCSSADDIRLHYFAASEYTKNRRNGGIGKIDNSIGHLVEIMICDIKSYLPAMYYMKSFNDDENLIVYWDEPTITLDYENHEFHSIIKKNWSENLISKMVLSSATLPKLEELNDAVSDFRNKFPNADIHNITSHDCKKSIPILNKDGFVVLPHYLSEDYSEILEIVQHCENYLTLSRYFDLKELVEFIIYIHENGFINNRMSIQNNFESLDDIDMKSIKIYYLKLLKNINPGIWGYIYNYFKNIRVSRIQYNTKIDVKGNKVESPIVLGNPGIYISTKDAFTLTDGPTIFISNDIEKISKFCIQQANIPVCVMKDIMSKIEFNNLLNIKINDLENEIEVFEEKRSQNVEKQGGEYQNKTSQLRSKTGTNSHKINRDSDAVDPNKSNLLKLTEEVNSLRYMIKNAVLNDTFVPNKILHSQKWAEGLDIRNAFTSDIDQNTVNDIMLLTNVDDNWKVLLMMGIGVFTNHENITYTEIMKKLADEQKLYMIIVTSDYIYGTNYQFCHAYLSKDLNLTQEKIIQAMGRVGRNNIQQNYTLRFRDDQQILKLFTRDSDKPEVRNMNILFNSSI